MSNNNEIELWSFLEGTPANEYEKLSPTVTNLRANRKARKAGKEIAKIDKSAVPNFGKSYKTDLSSKPRTSQKNYKGSRSARFAARAAALGLTAMLALGTFVTMSNGSSKNPTENQSPIVETQEPSAISTKNQKEEASYPLTIEDPHNESLINNNPNLLLNCYKENLRHAYKQKTGKELGDFYIRPKPTEVSTSSDGKHYHTKYDNVTYRSDSYNVQRYDGYQLYLGNPPSGNQKDDPNSLLCEVIVDSNGKSIVFEDSNDKDRDLKKLVEQTYTVLDSAVKYIDQSENDFYDNQPELLEKAIESYNFETRDKFGNLILRADNEFDDFEL